jgi:hypothetical protein
MVFTMRNILKLIAEKGLVVSLGVSSGKIVIFFASGGTIPRMRI